MTTVLVVTGYLVVLLNIIFYHNIDHRYLYLCMIIFNSIVNESVEREDHGISGTRKPENNRDIQRSQV